MKIHFAPVPVLALSACMLLSACGKKTVEGAPAAQAPHTASSAPQTSALTGTYVVNPQFESAFAFAEGLAQVRIGDEETGKWGYIDKQGKMVVNPQFDQTGGWSEGLAAAHIGDLYTGKSGFIDKSGKTVVKPQFDDTGEFSEGLAAVRIGDDTTGKWGYIHR